MRVGVSMMIFVMVDALMAMIPICMINHWLMGYMINCEMSIMNHTMVIVVHDMLWFMLSLMVEVTIVSVSTNWMSCV
jgi:hypothetical protein